LNVGKLVIEICCAGVIVSGCATRSPAIEESEQTEAPVAACDSAGEAVAWGALRGAGIGVAGAGVLLAVGAIVFPPLGVPLAVGMAPVLAGAGAVAGAGGAALTSNRCADRNVSPPRPHMTFDQFTARPGSADVKMTR
jgi:hypothetical protein